MPFRWHRGVFAAATVVLAGCEVVAPLGHLTDGTDTDASARAPGVDPGTAGDADAPSDPPGQALDGAPDVADAHDGGSDGGNTTPDAGADVAAGSDAGGCTLTSCGAREACVSGACVLARRVFVSSGTYMGNLGGHGGADATCQQLATAAGLGGVWMAWISDSASCPSARFDQASYAYRLLDGTVVAAEWNSLVSGSLAHGIDRDESGHPVAGTTEVWTATNPDGTLNGDGCSSFTSGAHGAPTPAVGVSGNADATWTEVYLQFCDRSDHVYCFEQ